MQRAKKRLERIVNRLAYGREEGIHDNAAGSRRATQAENTGPGARKDARDSARDHIGFQSGLEQHMAAAAFAEAGEFQSATEILDSVAKHKTVLLVIDGEAPNVATFDYALNLCLRTDRELDVLQVIERAAAGSEYEVLSHRLAESSRRLVELLQKLEQHEIPFKITLRLGDPCEKLLNYAKRHKDVSVVILDSPKATGPSTTRRVVERLAHTLSSQLSIPLVTVLEKSPA